MSKKSIKGTETEKNLMRAFSGESQARNRYTFFVSQARKEGYEVIARVFEKTADNEKEHAEAFFKQLEGGMVDFDASYPAGVIGTTAENLAAAAEGEYDEWENLYPEFAQVAQDEGFTHIAVLFRMISTVEQHHEKRYREVLEALKTNTLLSSDKQEDWECLKCGYHHSGTSAPDKCPVCGHPKGAYKKKKARR